jgi:hypothetical protein
MSFSVPTRSTLSSALAFGADITSENVANNTGSRRVKDDAAGMVILSANTKILIIPGDRTYTGSFSAREPSTV